jgi:hypothetical protein
MKLAIAHFTALLLIGLLAGSSLVNYVLESSLSDSAAFNIEYKQLVIRAYTVALPALGLGGILAALIVLYLARREKIMGLLWLLALVVLVLSAAALIKYLRK